MAKYDLFGTGATPPTAAPMYAPVLPTPSTKPKKQNKKKTNNESVSFATNETSLQSVSVLDDLNNVITKMMNDDEPFLNQQPTLFHDLILDSDDDDDDRKPAAHPTPSFTSNTASESTAADTDSAMFSSLSILADTCLFGLDNSNTMTTNPRAQINILTNNKENQRPSSSNININNTNNDRSTCFNSYGV
jgi:hypothetical protein